MEETTQGFADAASSFFDSIAQVLAQSSESLFDLSSRLNFVILVPIFCTVMAFLFNYFKHYQWPAEQLKAGMARVIGQIRLARFRQDPSPGQLRRELREIFSLSEFKPQWDEYDSSLHTIHGGKEDADWRIVATAPAEMFFSKESMVDLPIHADFYRHLPGILTGIGIIGTFSGLVWGLHEFKPDPSEALSSLPLLLQEVTSAFIGSGFAILAAIFVTFKEKSTLNACYRLIEELNREIDGVYAMGAGEEYLARLVEVSEAHPPVTLPELSAILNAHIERQQAVQEKHSEQIGTAIREALAEPMAELGGVVKELAYNQNNAVGQILEELLQGFMDRLDGTFGRQMSGLHESFQKSSDTVLQVQEALGSLIANLDRVNTSAIEQMTDRLEETIVQSAVSQGQMRQQMRHFVDELGDLLKDQQKQSADVAEVSVRAVLVKLQSALNQIALERSLQIEQDQQRHEALNSSVARLVDSMDKAVAKTTDNVTALQRTTNGAIAGMNDGAVVMRVAADRFAIAGNTLSGALGKSQELADTLSQLQNLVNSVAKMRKAS